jgi:hypothetical protein
MATKTKARVPELYQNAVAVDPITGAPADDLSAYLAYRNMALSAAEKASIPPDDREDAAQEMQTRFWKNDSLNRYDPDREVLAANGKTYTAKFPSMIRGFLNLSVRNERDKYIKYITHHAVKEVTEQHMGSNIEPDVAEVIIETEAARNWVNLAERALREADRADLIPVLRLCHNASIIASVVTRADIAAATGCKLREGTKLLAELREVLEQSGMGPDSLEK